MHSVDHLVALAYLFGASLAVRVAAYVINGPPAARLPSTRPGAREFERSPSPQGMVLTSVAATQDTAASDADCAQAARAGEANTTDGITNKTAAGDTPTHLVVLVHGLAGTPEDQTYLKEAVERRGGPGTLVHLASCNKENTKDGVAEGGTRLAHEVLGVVETTPSLSRISLVGNSLGGLYARYAASLLYSEGDGDGLEQSNAPKSDRVSSNGSDVAWRRERGSGAVGSGTVAGLQPEVFMSIAAPHLGVRRFTYIPVPAFLHGLAGVFVGKTGSDLFLADAGTPTARPPTSAPSVSKSSCIRSLPSTGSTGEEAAATTAAGVEDIDGIGTGAKIAVIREKLKLQGDSGADRYRGKPLLYDMATTEDFLRPLKAFRTRRAYANRRGDFMVPYETAAFLAPKEEDGTDERGPALGSTSDVGSSAAFGLGERFWGRKQGLIVGTLSIPPAAGALVARAESRSGGVSVMSQNDMEEEMAAGLNSCGWQKVAVDFGGLLPFSHNKICALSRTTLTASLYGSGRNIMDHAADCLVAAKRPTGTENKSHEREGSCVQESDGVDGP